MHYVNPVECSVIRGSYWVIRMRSAWCWKKFGLALLRHSRRAFLVRVYVCETKRCASDILLQSANWQNFITPAGSPRVRRCKKFGVSLYVQAKHLRHPWDVIKWKHFQRYLSPVNSPHKGQWRGALMLLWSAPWISDWVNNREAGDLRRIALIMTSL